jgi:YbgC/YbaW family acyl-CoA thioester hydrolase
MEFVYKKKIYGYECDVYGHLNNAIYLQVFEAARCEALIDMKMPIGKLNDDGVMMFITRAEVDYKKGIMVDENITVRSRIYQHDRLSACWRQEIYDGASTLCSMALIKIVYVKDYKACRISKELYAFFDIFFQSDEVSE